ncbi:hypothetical protein GCM10009548_04720 [Streptomyces malaysiensis subsp. malaysiensis]
MVVPGPGLDRAGGGPRVVGVGSGVRALGARGRRGGMGRRSGGGGARGIGGNQRQQDGEEHDEHARDPVAGGRDGAGCRAHPPSLSCWVLDFLLSARRGGRSGAPAGE